MYEQFPEWLSRVYKNPSNELIGQRWRGVEQVIDDMVPHLAINLARLAYGIEHVEDEFLKSFRSTFQAVDLTFPTHDNNAELSVLAGAALAQLLDYDQYVASDIGAIAILTRSLGMMIPESLPELLGLSERYLMKRAVELRQVDTIDRIHFSLASKAKITNAFKEFVASLASDDDEEQAKKLAEPSSVINLEIAELADRANQSLMTMNRSLKVVREESNVLWWAFNARSQSHDKAFKELGISEATLVAGGELACLTIATPGPLRAKEFLAKVLLDAKGRLDGVSTVQDVVNCAPLDWRKRTVDAYYDESLRDMCPLLSALRKSVDTGGLDDWQSAFFGVTGIKASLENTHLELSHQFFLEISLIQMLGEWQDE